MWVLAQFFSSDGIMQMAADIPVLILRTVITFVAVLLVVRWTGKRSIANLAPFDLAMVIVIGEVAAIPVAELKVDLLHGILPALLIGGLHVLMTTLNLHSHTLEKITEGNPTLLVKDGKVLRQNLLKERVSMSDLTTAFRHKEVSDLSQVAEAHIEHAGGISVIKTKEADYVTPGQLHKALDEIATHIVAELKRELPGLMKEHGKQGGG